MKNDNIQIIKMNDGFFIKGITEDDFLTMIHNVNVSNQVDNFLTKSKCKNCCKYLREHLNDVFISVLT